jgi:L-amino acid N-acyltransferase YncA
MRDRSLVARIAADNHASIRLHRSVGWRLYPDGEVVLAVHERRPAA